MRYLFLFFCLILCSCSDKYYGCAGEDGMSGKITAMKSSSEEPSSSNYSGCEPPSPPDNIIDSITTEGESW